MVNLFSVAAKRAKFAKFAKFEKRFALKSVDHAGYTVLQMHFIKIDEKPSFNGINFR